MLKRIFSFKWNKQDFLSISDDKFIGKSDCKSIRG